MMLQKTCSLLRLGRAPLAVMCALALASACDDGGGGTETDASSSTGDESRTSDASASSDGSTSAGPTTDGTTADMTTGGMTTGTLSEFALTIYPDIIASNCSCHVGGTGGLTMSSAAVAYENLVGVSATQLPEMNRVEPGDATSSYLIHKLDGTHLDVGGSGVSMPKGGTLTGDQINAVREWVNNGAM